MSRRYFAYGSNMDPEEMSLRCASARLLGSARLPDHRLAFTRRSVRNYPGSGVADLVPVPGETVWGALYEVSEQDLAVLDHKEAAGQAYEQIMVEVVGPDERREHALAYTVIDKADPEVPPSPLYLGRLVDGARACALPDGYIAFLESLRTEDAARAREVERGRGARSGCGRLGPADDPLGPQARDL